MTLDVVLIIHGGATRVYELNIDCMANMAMSSVVYKYTIPITM